MSNKREGNPTEQSKTDISEQSFQSNWPHKTQDEDKQNTKHRIKTNKTQNTGLRQAKHKAQDEDKQNTR